MQISPRKALIHTLAALTLLAITLTPASCSKEDCPTCPTCSEPKTHNDLYDGRLYVAAWNCDDELCHHTYSCIYIIDTGTETLVDSIVYSPLTDIHGLVVSDDGRYIVTRTQRTHLYDAATLEEIAVPASVSGPFLDFTSGARYLLFSRDGGLAVYSIPDFQLVHEDSVGVGQYLPSHNSTFCIVEGGLELYEYSLDSFQVVSRWQVRDREGEPFIVGQFDLSADGRFLYASGNIESERSNWHFITFDLTGDSAICAYPVFLAERVVANPDGSEVYALEWPDEWRLEPGIVGVFDAHNGELRENVSLWGPETYFGDRLFARGIAVTPDGSQLYVATDASANDIRLGPSTVLRIDTRTKRIENLLFPDFYDGAYILAQFVAAAPKP